MTLMKCLTSIKTIAWLTLFILSIEFSPIQDATALQANKIPTGSVLRPVPSSHAIFPAPPVLLSKSRRKRRKIVPIRYTPIQVKQYIAQALHITHKPLNWAKPLYWIAYQESRFYTHAIDGVAAQNVDLAGHAEHAEGLFQVVPATFDRHALRGMRNIWNPVDNAVASIRYIAGRYRSPLMIQGIENVHVYGGY